MQQKHLRQSKFLKALLENEGSKAAAIKESGIPESTVHRWFALDEDFKMKVKTEFADIEEVLLPEAISRALKGSDIMLKFLLSAANPERYDPKARRSDSTRSRIVEVRDQPSLSRSEARRELMRVFRSDPMEEFVDCLPTATSKE